MEESTGGRELGAVQVLDQLLPQSQHTPLGTSLNPSRPQKIKGQGYMISRVLCGFILCVSFVYPGSFEYFISSTARCNIF